MTKCGPSETIRPHTTLAITCYHSPPPTHSHTHAHSVSPSCSHTQDKYVFEMWPGDLLGPKALQSFFTSVQEKVYFGDWLCYRPCTTIQEKVGAEAQIPIITSDELFRGVKFQPLTMGYAFGEFHTFLGPASSVRKYESPSHTLFHFLSSSFQFMLLFCLFHEPFANLLPLHLLISLLTK